MTIYEIFIIVLRVVKPHTTKSRVLPLNAFLHVVSLEDGNFISTDTPRTQMLMRQMT